MTTPSVPDPTPLFAMDAPDPLTPVERLLALAGLYTQHNDRIDLLFSSRSTVRPDAYVSSVQRLEREALACVKTVQQQRLPAIEPVTSAIVRLKQIAYLTGGATRYLTAAQHALPDDMDLARPHPRRGFGQHIHQARELTALAPATVVDSAERIAARLPSRVRTSTAATGMDAAQRGVLLEVARGHVLVTEQYGQRGYGHTLSVDVDVLHHLEVQGLVIREPATAPPFLSGEPPRDRVCLTGPGLSALDTVIDAPLRTNPAPGRPVPAPATAARAHARR
ncbi:hypothetical protein ACFV1X_21340 [Streptomyces coelicoflavus]|uniref:hypothetical protein n=1 Tax=Streptomyces coelicoflavus TaxID=285562 RepID=UPI0036A98983